MASSAAKRPITGHPAFRWMVALWFAALIGFGLFVMPEQTHAFILGRTGLALPPQIDPRLAVSVAGAVVGLLFGLLIGRTASPRAAPVEDWGDEDAAFEDAAATNGAEMAPSGRRRFLNPREDLGDDGIDGAAPEVEPVVEDADFVDLPAGEPDWDADEDEDEDEGETGPALSWDEDDYAEDGDYAGGYDPGFADAEEPAPGAADARRPEPQPIETDAIADLSLPELTDRLGRALAAAGGRAMPQGDRRRPRVAPLADPEAPDRGVDEDEAAPQGPSEDALRSALARLSRVRKGE